MKDMNEGMFEDIGLKLRELFDDHQTGMSDFQDDYFVTSKAGGTAYGQYKQALRECYKRFRGLRDMIYGEGGNKFLELNIEEAQQKFEKITSEKGPNSVEARKAVLSLQHKIMLREEAHRSLIDTYREFLRFYQHAKHLKEKIGIISPERRRELELEMWTYRAKEFAALDYLQAGRLTNRTLEFVTIMPKKARDRLLPWMFNNGDQHVQQEWLSRAEPDIIPFEDIELPRLSVGEIEKQLFISAPPELLGGADLSVVGDEPCSFTEKKLRSV